MLQYLVTNYKRVVYLAPLIRKLKDLDLSNKEPRPLKGYVIKGASHKAKKRKEIKLKKHLDRIYTLEYNTNNLYYLV